MDDVTRQELEKRIPWHNQACGRCNVSAELHHPSNGACEMFEFSEARWLQARPIDDVVVEHERRIAALERFHGKQ